MPETIDNLLALINQIGLKIGTAVKSAAGAQAATAVSQLSVDASGNLQLTVPVTANQPTITGELLNVTGTGSANIMTQTLVGGSDATTWTKTGWIRVNITDAGGRLTNGYHYIQVGTLT